MPADTVTVRCPSCSRTWQVGRRDDGTFPATARCATSRGGCGRVSVKVPRRAPSPRYAAPLPAAAASWEPPSRPRALAKLDDPCPHCGAREVYAEARGTVRACVACRKKVAPPGVLAPYERGTEVTRAAKSQRERDLEALDLAGRKGVMLGELRRLAGDDRLDDASVMKVEWFAEQVKAAPSGVRLDDLADLFAAERIRPRGWFQRPASITAGYDEDGYPEDDDEGQDDDAPVVLAPPVALTARPARMTWADAIAACGWRLSPTIGRCQMVDQRGAQCGNDTGSPAIPDQWGRHAWLCGPHYATLGGIIASDYQRQQRTA